jgi:hypothetical protein
LLSELESAKPIRDENRWSEYVELRGIEPLTPALQTLYGSVIQYQIGFLSSGNVLGSVGRCLGVTARSLTLR